MVAVIRRLRTHSAADDSGYSLSELLVVIALMGFVLAVAYNLNFFVSKASAQNEREAWFGSEVRTPLMYIDKLLMQNTEIEGSVSTPYSISFFTDVNLDDVRERNIIKSEGGVLTLTSWNVNGLKQNVGAPIRSSVLSRSNANEVRGEALFTYLDSLGTPITDSTKYGGTTRSIRTTIVVDYDGHIFSDSRQTFLRNRN